MSVFEILLPAFVASLILTGIHAYLGVHVVERGVIFVDLSLAQIAALGTTVGLPRGLRPALERRPTSSRSASRSSAPPSSRSPASTARPGSPRRRSSASSTPSSAAVAILVMSKATQETEHLKEMLVGNILSVSWKELGEDGRPLRARRALPLRLPRAVPADLDERAGGRAAGLQHPLLGLPLLRLLRLRRDVLGRDRRRAARLLLPDRAVGRGDALRRAARLRLAIGWTMGAVVSAGGVALSFLWTCRPAPRSSRRSAAALLILAGVPRAFRRPGVESD